MSAFTCKKPERTGFAVAAVDSLSHIHMHVESLKDSERRK